MAKPLILVTNDDGINAPGIRNLISVMKEIGDIIVVLTNLAELEGFAVEDCIDAAYTEIANRTGIMHNGTFVKTGITADQATDLLKKML